MKKHNIMKSGIFLAAVLLVSLGTTGCERDKNGRGPSDDGELRFYANVKDPVTVTRGIANEFFDVGHTIDVEILSTATGASPVPYTYEYTADGIFVGKPPFMFALDDTYITTLTATWPSEAIRQEGIITDQREYDNYRLADWLIATASAGGIMPTDTPVPLYFDRQNTMLEFEVVGQTSKNLNIESLLLELEVEDKQTGAYVPTAFWAYCDPETGHAYLILDPYTSIVADEGYLIGRITIEGNSNYTIVMPQTDITLEPATRYLVTLLPRGYDMSMYAYISGWIQEENGIGIPFTKPDENDGHFTINIYNQLITMSYLIRHYVWGGTYPWPTEDYVISDDFTITDEQALLYIPIPASIFSGSITDEAGNPLTTVTTVEGTVIELFDEDY